MSAEDAPPPPLAEDAPGRLPEGAPPAELPGSVGFQGGRGGGVGVLGRVRFGGQNGPPRAFDLGSDLGFTSGT